MPTLSTLVAVSVLAIGLSAHAGSVRAQSDPAAGQAADPAAPAAAARDCPASNEPATPPAPGPSSGTAPGNEGSTGWTGGTGGSHTGTTPHADLDGAGSGEADAQPETVQGLDLKGAPAPC